MQNTNLETVRGAGYPPYNVIKRDDGHFLIEIAVAGFKKEDIDLILEKGILTITGKKVSGLDTREYAHRGISQRAFERSFTLADTLKVVGASIAILLLVKKVDLSERCPLLKLLCQKLI